MDERKIVETHDALTRAVLRWEQDGKSGEERLGAALTDARHALKEWSESGQWHGVQVKLLTDAVTVAETRLAMAEQKAS